MTNNTSHCLWCQQESEASMFIPLSIKTGGKVEVIQICFDCSAELHRKHIEEGNQKDKEMYEHN